MAQTLSIIGLALSLLALYLASEVTRRSSQRFTQLEASLYKLQARLQQVEGNMFHVDRLAAELRHQKKRQAETLNALAAKGEAQAAAPAEAAALREAGPREVAHDRFTPSEYKASKAG